MALAEETVDVITVRDLTYTYKGQAKPAVDGISFSVQRGEIFGLLGPSGAGKSTTQKVLTRQQRSYSGSVTILGKDLSQWGQDYFERIGVGFELPNHYLKFTARENLAFFASLYARPSRDPRDMMALVGLEDYADKKVETFSKGMRMRLNFVRAIQHDPELIFLDEPTAGLDPVNAGIVKQLIAGLARDGKTVVLTTHNMNDVDQLCDRISFMVDGRFAALDRPQALKAAHGRRMVAVTPETGPVEEFAMDGLGENARFLDMLRAGRIERIHSQEASLDKVFTDVTGHRLDQAEPEAVS
ncbi:ABC transporter ATP-binding protein [Devosia sp. XJ19-1]|uniref:ABC transporter ATP-binding protein n=1 Tax=Devosia ureilytica TaxID=2952754 RepID=A0A9Q4AQB5_9HYPH|nr:ABC transporter ATP-binding protein [Devosia ureilytica]MCP8884272.1 ABC transporter ATP-binding protein [Devosia ureilytica]MCP8887880.1 ABC transporter ATP-binding protein [Devosia ureilytica]